MDFEEALVVFEPVTGAVVYANAAAADLFAVSSTSPRGRASDWIPELADPSLRRFETSLSASGATGRIDVSIEALEAGELAHGVALLARIRPRRAASLGGNGRATPELAAPTEARLAALWDLVVRGGLASESKVPELLREAARGLGLERATIARVVGRDLAIEYASDPAEIDLRLPVDGSPAAAALLRSGRFAVLDTALTPDFAPILHHTRSFVAATFGSGDDLFALTFSSADRRAVPFAHGDWIYLETVVEALQSAIEQRQADRRVEQLAYFDALTSLPNRIAILQRMDDAIAHAARTDGRMAILFLDIDGFKGVNDTIGHRGGDVVLAEIAQRLRGTLRRDEYIGRLGGDEFAIVMPDARERHDVDSIAQRIGGVLTFPFAVGEYRFSLSASIGVAVFPDDGTGREELLESADAAMYAAKDDGGSRVRFRSSSAEPGDLHAATPLVSREPRDSGYILCYQPVIDLATSTVVAAEALIRRIHPQHGLLAPERGWSIAHDEAGRKALDRWVLREATAQIRMWQQAGVSLRVDVNLAAFDPTEIDDMLADPSLAAHVRRLRIEVVQEQFVDARGADVATKFVRHCAASGIGFVLDGFDAGFATVSSLAELPIGAVKLGRSLVEGVLTNRTTRAVAVGTIIVAKSLGWNVIAKGVETSAEYEAVVGLGCDGMQGYYVAHPMTAIDFGTWLRGRELVGQETG